MNIISSNPYRLLGVYSNSSAKDRIANANKLKAYLKVGKSVSFPLDLLNFVSAPVRTVENMEQAIGSISIPHDQLKYALFWFIKVSSIDEMALDYLQRGDIEKAKELLNKKETFSSLINLGVLSLIQNDKSVAIQAITKVIHNEDYRVAFIEAVCGSTCQLSENELSQLFMDELLVEISVQELMPLFLENGVIKDDYHYLKNKAVSEPIANINAEIAKAKKVKNDDADAQYRTGVALMNNTKEPLSIIRGLLEANDMQYQMVADNLAKQILQCGINYYNNSEEPDAAIKAMTIQKYALQIAVGALIKDRCQENVNILQKIINNLPPLEVINAVNAINTELEQFCKRPDKITHAITLLKNTQPYLTEIKERLGCINVLYLHLSTQVVGNALHNVIEEVNATQKDGTILRAAWEAIKFIDTFDMESDFKEHYNKNRNILKGMCEEFRRLHPKPLVAPTPIVMSNPPLDLSKHIRQSQPITPIEQPENKDTLSIVVSWGFLIAIIIILITLFSK